MKKLSPIRKGVFALLLALGLGMGTAYAHDFSAVCSTGQTLYYNIIDATNRYVEITYPGTDPWIEFTKPTGNITLPSTVTYDGVTYSVKAISSYAFYYCENMTGTLNIPNSVTTIGNYAFFNCTGFTGSLTIGNSVTTIGDFAFCNCTGFAGSLTLGSSVTTIGNSAFSGCHYFTGNLTIPNSVTMIDDYAFAQCYNLTGSLTIPNSVTTIGMYAFYSCEGFTGSLIIGNSMTEIRQGTFDDCKHFTSLTLGNSVTMIGEHAFFCCYDLSGSLTLPNSLTTIGNAAFYQCDFTGALIIPNTVTTIGDYAFYFCNGFTGSLTIPSSVISIGKSAFKNCTGFTQVNYNAANCADVTYGDKPFENCRCTLTIGNTVTRIPAYMFENCSNFTGTLTLPNSLTTIGDYAFDGCRGFTGTLTLPNSLTTIGDYAFRNCRGFTGSLTIPNSVVIIGESAFDVCYGFSGTLTIGNSVTTIGVMAFYGLDGFTSLNLGNSVTTISGSAFAECRGFTGSLTIPNSVTSIGDYAFEDCDNFTGTLTIGNSVTTIGESAFSGCSGFMGALTIGSSVAEIGDEAFFECSGLSSVTMFPETPPTLGTNVFYGVPKTIPMLVPCGTISAYQNASGWNEFTNLQDPCYEPLTYSINEDGVSVTVTGHVDGTDATGPLVIPETKTIDGVTYAVTKIGDYAFSQCTGLTGSLTIPNSVTSIGMYAFYFCEGFTGSLTIGNSVTEIGQGAFNNCKHFTSLTLGNSVTTIGQQAFFCCYDLAGGLTLPNSLITIDNSAFYQCAFTGPLIIPNNVTMIGDYAFYFCSGFTGSLTIPDAVTSIGAYAFNNCYQFTGTLTLGNSVTTIGERAFYYCNGFTGTLTIPNSVTSIGTSAFTNCTGFTQVKFNAINCADVTNEDKPFEGCGGTLTIGSYVTRIPAYMFYQCSGFTGWLSIPSSVTTIGEGAFYGCSGFTSSLTFGNSVTTIGDYAFRDCTGFTGSLTLPNSVTTIGSAAFANCPGFTGTLTIPNSVTTIGTSAFSTCTNFTGLILGNSVTALGHGAFFYCINLSSITVLPEIPPTLGLNAFYDVPTTIPVYVPCGSLDAYQSTGAWSEFTNYQCNPEVTVTAVPTQGGTVTGGGTYTYGTSCTVTATPSSGYQFMHWSKNGTVVSCNASYTFTATQDVDLEAVFVSQSYLGDIIGSGTNASEYLPSHSYYRYSLSEQIYTASEMGGSTTINTILFFNAGTTKTRTYDIYMRHTTNTSFSSSTDWISVTSSNKVFSGSVTMRAGMWTTIVLDTPFAYNGSYNLVLVVDDNTGSFSSGMMCRTYATSGNQAIRIYSDGTNYNPSSPSSYTGTCMMEKNQIMLNRPGSLYDITATSANTSEGTVSGGGTYGYGDLCRLKATAKSGYTFVDWVDELGTVVSTDANYAFFVTEEISLTARFMSGTDVCYLTFDLHDSWGDGWNGNQLVVNYPNGMSEKLTVPSGDEATFTLPIPDGGYMELGWIAGNYIYECSFEVRYSDGNLLYMGRNLASSFEYEFEMNCAGPTEEWTYIGDHSTANNYYLPSWSYYKYGLSEQIYTADEIGTAGIINGIAFYNEGAQTRTRNYDIYLKRTDKTVFESPTDWIGASDAQLVYSGDVTMISGTWTPIAFTYPFEYDGVSNLVLIVDDNMGTYTNMPYMSCRVFNADGLQTLRIYSDDIDYDPNSPSEYTGTLQSIKNQIRMDITPACLTPFDLEATDITSTSANINWNLANESFELQYREVGGNNDFTFGLGNWTTIDADGDGYNWYYFQAVDHDGSAGLAQSDSWYGDALTPDNYLVSPQITLGGSITFWASAYSSSYPYEHFGVAVSTAGDTNAADFTTIQEWTMTAKGEGSKTGRSRDGGNRTQGNWYQYTVDLSAYSGLGYVAIRHFNCSDQWSLIVDDITIVQPGVNGVNTSWTTVSDVTSPYALTGLTPRSYYEVRARSICDENQYSDWAYTMFTTLAPPTVTQTVTLSAGWSWWSTYIEADDVLNQLKAALGTNGMSINTQGAVLVYRNGMWMGGMNSIDNAKGYKIKTNAPVEVTIEGQIVDPSTCPITITQGANWIGYPLPVSQTVGNALAGFTPSNGDVIMTQGGTTVYRSGHWMPATFTFEPGKAYIYKSTSSTSKTLIFSNSK